MSQTEQERYLYDAREKAIRDEISRRKYFERLDQDLKNRQDELQKRETALEERSATLEERSATLEERSATLEERSATLEERSAALRKKEIELQERVAEVRRKEREASLRKMQLIRQINNREAEQGKRISPIDELFDCSEEELQKIITNLN